MAERRLVKESDMELSAIIASSKRAPKDRFDQASMQTKMTEGRQRRRRWASDTKRGSV